MIGERISKLVVIDTSKRRVGAKSRVVWKCLCDCGNTCEVLAENVRAGLTTSCGCNRAHRLARSGLTARSPEYRAWQGIKQRCLNPKSPRYADWGGRGITMYQPWIADFDSFLAEIGRRPGPEFSVDRIDNDRGYVPGNVRWATAAQQANNRRRRDAPVKHSPSKTTPPTDKE